MHARRARARRGGQATVSPRSNGAQVSRGRVLSKMVQNWFLVRLLTPSKATGARAVVEVNYELPRAREIGGRGKVVLHHAGDAGEVIAVPMSAVVA
ncbi:MAG: hypothetical protein AAB676_10810 [Verrucomicrobiota bacterium]